MDEKTNENEKIVHCTIFQKFVNSFWRFAAQLHHRFWKLRFLQMFAAIGKAKNTILTRSQVRCIEIQALYDYLSVLFQEIWFWFEKFSWIGDADEL